MKGASSGQKAGQRLKKRRETTCIVPTRGRNTFKLPITQAAIVLQRKDPGLGGPPSQHRHETHEQLASV
jgi:hypothetical protein